MKKSKVGLSSAQQVTAASTPAADELLCYQNLTEDQYTAGLTFVRSKKMGHEHGFRPDEEGFYIKLFPDNRSDTLVTQFEAALG